jgi:DNA-binding PadR family transcriptional regulator
VLGLLSERSGYGYDLQGRFARRFAYLGLGETSVYQLLNRLERDGWIAARGPKAIGATPRGAPRVTYAVTPAGRAELRAWMRRSSPPAPVRDELHAKLVLAAPEDLPGLIEATRLQERACRRALAAVPAHGTITGETSWAETASALVDGAYADRLRAQIAWLERARAAMERRVAADAPIA